MRNHDRLLVECYLDRKRADEDARMTAEESAAWFRLSPVDRCRLAGFGIKTKDQVNHDCFKAMTDDEYRSLDERDHRLRLADSYRDL